MHLGKWRHKKHHIKKKEKRKKISPQLLSHKLGVLARILKVTALPNSISTCFKLPLFATFFCSWFRLLLLADLPSQKLSKKNPTKSQIIFSVSLLYLSSLHFDCDDPFAVSDTSWLWSKVPQRKHGTCVLQLKVSCSADRAALYETKGETEARQIEERRRKKGGWECLKSKCVFFYQYEYVRESERGEREREMGELGEDWLLTTWTSHISPLSLLLLLLLLSSVFYSRFTPACSLKGTQRQFPSWHYLTTIGVIYHWSFSVCLKCSPAMLFVSYHCG